MSRYYTAIGAALLLVMICATGVGQEQQSEMIKIPARPDDLVIGFARILEPKDGNWVFEIKDDMLFLNGLQYHPTPSVYAEKYAIRRDVPDEIRERAHIQFKLTNQARSIYERSGIDSAAAMLRSSAYIDSVWVDNNYTLFTYFKADNGNVSALTFSRTPPDSWEGAYTRKSRRDVQLARIEQFRQTLEKGGGIMFGTSTNTLISHKRREFVRAAMNALTDSSPDSLTPEQSRALNLDSPGFRKDLANAQKKGE